MSFSKPLEAGMNKTKEEQLLAQVIGRVFEDAAFVFSDTLEPSKRPLAGTWDAQGVSLSFTGEHSGTLRMWASRGFACYAAANMLGVEEGSPGAREKGMDALRELLNIVVGNYLPLVYGEDPVFDLGLPQELFPAHLDRDRGDPGAVWLEAEGNAVMFVVDMADD
ncbi:MAG: hypothetical protein GF418_12120 [Chitinivibrionales bacterium]|nr:hypothetical protein [Chitinivibrionales bacterium]MBD3396364.1 hypothetical protein [Chitinivibrionales bacterium]